jgi:CheY-like chemotaxis protein
VAVGSGEEALALLEANEKFDVAILDMQMPGMDGEMLAREIRKKFTKEQLPLIMLTSIGNNMRSAEVQQFFSDYVNKPVKHSVLADILLAVFMHEENSTTQNRENEPDLKLIAVKYPFEILIAEDNFINQKLVRKLFEVLGYKTDLAANGYEAIESLKRKPYDIVFMDVQMPEMDGYEATRIIKERWKTKAPIIIAMTANAMQGDKEKSLFAGMDDYLSKPLRLDDLLRVINQWGEKKKLLSRKTH